MLTTPILAALPLLWADIAPRGLIAILVAGVVVGLILWLINQYVPMPSPFKNVLNVIVAILFLVWALGALGLY